MTVPTIQCEARVRSRIHRKSKSGDWISVTFEISPIDLPEELWDMDEGQRVVLVLAAIGDDEQPVRPKTKPDTAGAGEAEPKPRLRDLPRSRQMQKMCGVPEFQHFVWQKNHPGGQLAGHPDAYSLASEAVKILLKIDSSKDLDVMGPPEWPELFHDGWDTLYSAYEQAQGRMAREIGK